MQCQGLVAVARLPTIALLRDAVACLLPPMQAAAHPACAPGTAFGMAMPLDCFWAPF